MTDAIRYEQRGAFDNPKEKAALAFTIGDKRIAIFKHHDPSHVGIAVTLPSGSVGCFAMPCGEFYAIFEREYLTRAAAEVGKEVGG